MPQRRNRQAAGSAVRATADGLAHPSRRIPRPRRHCFAPSNLLATVLVLAALALARCAAAAVDVASAKEVFDVGGEHVTVDPSKIIGAGTSGVVYDAKDSKGRPAVYKELRQKRVWKDHEIEATKAAGQYISHDSVSMVQKKVGTHDLEDYLDEKKRNPGGWKPNSAEIIRQVDKQQNKMKFSHTDAGTQNIRVDTTKTNKQGAPKFRLVDWGLSEPHSTMTPREIESNRNYSHKDIKKECAARGFEFRSRGGLYRRGPGACSTKPKQAARQQAKSESGASKVTGKPAAAARQAAAPATGAKVVSKAATASNTAKSVKGATGVSAAKSGGKKK
ncbi:hypothetical protein DFJ73DRAFT_914049 [Zopfochytrium polystomum]|nr:hypothetical protein DFJ73DRAFT_914049 [Zopfochytrium polystomum]